MRFIRFDLITCSASKVDRIKVASRTCYKLNRINRMTTRSRWKFRICTATNDLTLYSFSSLYIFVTWGWPKVAETCRQPNKTDTKTVVFWRNMRLSSVREPWICIRSARAPSVVRQIEELWSLIAVTPWIQLHTAHIWRPESKDRHVAWTVSVTTTTVIFETMLVSPITCLEPNPKSFISPILKASGHGPVCCSHDRRSVGQWKSHDVVTNIPWSSQQWFPAGTVSRRRSSQSSLS